MLAQHNKSRASVATTARPKSEVVCRERVRLVLRQASFDGYNRVIEPQNHQVDGVLDLDDLYTAIVSTRQTDVVREFLFLALWALDQRFEFERVVRASPASPALGYLAIRNCCHKCTPTFFLLVRFTRELGACHQHGPLL